MKNFFGLKSLIFATICVAIFEGFSLAGMHLPKPIALPFYAFFILMFGYDTVRQGLHALITLDFKNITLLMIVAVSGAFYLGEYPEAAVVIILFTLAERLEDIGIAKSRSALDALIDKMPKTVLIKGKEAPVPVGDVRPGDVMLIKPSQMIPIDGIVRDGASFVDESPVTGEPLARDKRPGDLVFAGTFNKQGFLEAEATKTASDSALQKIREMTFDAIRNKAPTQQFIERFSAYYTPLIIFLALFWMLFNLLASDRPFEVAFSEALVLLVIACPCALVISAPVSIFSAIGNASRSGALIKGGRYLEAIGQIKAIALDKTRTLTYGEPVVTEVVPFGSTSRELLLSCAAGIEALSEHPLAESVVEAAKRENLTFHSVEKFESIVGKGAKAECLVCDDAHRCIGKLEFILEEHTVPPEIIERIEYFQNKGNTVITVSTSREIAGLIVVRDKLRPDAADLIAKLKRAGIHPVMLTGDHSGVAGSVAREIGIEDVRADLLPEGKAVAVRELIEKYRKVAMFGDGVNDAPALALSDVGISMSSLGSDTALEAASIVILNDRLDLIPFLVKLGRKTVRTIRFNTAFAIVVKAIFIAAAFSGMSRLALAIFADVGVTLIVIFIALRLSDWKDPETS